MPGVVKQYSCMQAVHVQDFTLLLVTPLTEWVSRTATPCASFCVHPSCDGCPKRATPCARHVCIRIAHGYQFVNDHPRWPHHAHSCARMHIAHGYTFSNGRPGRPHHAHPCECTHIVHSCPRQPHHVHPCAGTHVAHGCPGRPLLVQGIFASVFRMVTHLQMAIQDGHTARILVCAPTLCTVVQDGHFLRKARLHPHCTWLPICKWPSRTATPRASLCAHPHCTWLSKTATSCARWPSRTATLHASLCVHPRCAWLSKMATPCARRVCIRIGLRRVTEK